MATAHHAAGSSGGRSIDGGVMDLASGGAGRCELPHCLVHGGYGVADAVNAIA
jgi:hypothetical protein